MANILGILHRCSIFEHGITFVASPRVRHGQPGGRRFGLADGYQDRRFLPCAESRPLEITNFIRDFRDRSPAAAWSAGCTDVCVLPRVSRGDGFCLLEVIVATTTLIVALSALAQLLSVATLATRGSRIMTLAAVFAQQKMEDLVPRAAIGGVGLGASPSDALARDVDGYSDFVDASGIVVGLGTTAPAAAVYRRRWSIEPLSTSPATLVLHVLVTDARGPHAGDASAAQPGAAHIVSLVRAVS
jgi:hypothetical protein